MSSLLQDVDYTLSRRGREMEVEQCIDYLVGQPFVSLRPIFMSVNAFQVYSPTLQWVDNDRYVCFGRLDT